MGKIVYLAGPISHYLATNQSDKASGWRKRIREEIEDVDIEVFDPTYKGWEDEEHNGFYFFTYVLSKSTVMIVKFSDSHVFSNGTNIELGIAHENRIPVICINETGAELDTWQKCCITKEFKSENAALEYVCSRYLYR